MARLTAALAQLFPLTGAPLLFNLVAILFQVLPVSFFLSSRFASLGTQRSRFLLGFLYLALPNSFEVNANVTNAQWHLALLACLVVLPDPPTSLFCPYFHFFLIVFASLP